MPLHAAIVTKDLRIGAAIHARIIEDVAALTCQQYPRVTVYGGRDFPDRDDAFDIYEGTRAVNKMGAHFAVFPEVEVTEHSPNRLPVAESGLPKFTPEMIAGIGRDTEVDGLVDAYADFILEHIRNKHGEPRRAQIPENIEAQGRLDFEATHYAANPARHAHGSVIIFGGQGPEAGNDALVYLAERYPNITVLLESRPGIANPVEYYLAQQNPELKQAANPIPELREEARKGDSLHFDSMGWMCVTINGPEIMPHLFHDDGGQPIAYKTPIINMVHEAVRMLPEDRPVIVMGTEATIAMQSFPKAAAELGLERNFNAPSEESQHQISAAIWEDIIPGNHSRARGRLLQEMERNRAEHGQDTLHVLACTELSSAVGISWRGESGRELPQAENIVPGAVDTIQIGADAMAAQALRAAEERHLDAREIPSASGITLREIEEKQPRARFAR